MNIKGMDKNMQCRGYQFEIGKEYMIETNGRPLELCSDTVFHYCKSLQQVHQFYNCRNEENRYFEIEVLGEEVTDNEKCGSNHIKIIREIKGTELDVLKGLDGTNTGLFNTGYCNTGDCNTGNKNTGDWNTGNKNTGYCNTGNKNIGDWNTGNKNTGNCNTGYWNTGNKNTGDCNTGYWNTGNNNTGDCNTGYWNTGDKNTGYCNTGDKNTGDKNTGDKNTSDWNTGNCNTGYCNTGDWNTGVANKCNFSNGVFCNESDMNIRIFNKPSGMSLYDFYKSRYWDAMCAAPFILTEWVYYTADEKAADSEKERVGGYLKVYSMEEAWANWWNNLSEEARQIIQEIPNFDPEIFKDITGIEV